MHQYGKLLLSGMLSGQNGISCLLAWQNKLHARISVFFFLNLFTGIFFFCIISYNLDNWVYWCRIGVQIWLNGIICYPSSTQQILHWVNFSELLSNSIFGVLMYLLLASEVTKRKSLKSILSNGNHSTKPRENHVVFKAITFISYRVGTVVKRLRYFTAGPKTPVEILFWNHANSVGCEYMGAYLTLMDHKCLRFFFLAVLSATDNWMWLGCLPSYQR